MSNRDRRRSQSTRVVVLMTDGRSDDDVLRPARSLKAQGVRIFVVGIGRYINGKQLDAIASLPRRTHIFTADWRHLQPLVNPVRDAVCLGESTNNLLNESAF